MVKRKPLSAGYGIGAWVAQRVTAVIMAIAILEVFFFIYLANDIIDSNFITWQQFFSFTFVKIFAQITFAAVAIHAWVGIRDLWMDYVKSYGARLVLHSATILWLAGCLVYSAKILWL
jgi:succinate dehydrogenase / fumarate reductase membrane anchor subunit